MLVRRKGLDDNFGHKKTILKIVVKNMPMRQQKKRKANRLCFLYCVSILLTFVYTECILKYIMDFEWDSIKNRRNIEKHGIDFTDAVRIFERPTLTVVDNRRDYGEKRIAAMGTIEDVILYVVYTVRDNVLRIISARRANRRERKKYFEIFPK